MIFYYRVGAGDWHQIEADSYRNSGFYGWVFRLGWRGGLTEEGATGDTNPDSVYQIGGRCSSEDRGIAYTGPGGNRCAENGFAPREHLNTLSFRFVKCSIEFLKEGRIIKTVNGDPDCPEVSGDPRNPGCEECCKELLPMMRSLHI